MLDHRYKAWTRAFPVMLAAYFALAPVWAEFQSITCGTERATGAHACCLPAPEPADTTGSCCASKPQAPAAPGASEALSFGAAFCQCAHDALPLSVTAVAHQAPERVYSPALDVAPCLTAPGQVVVAPAGAACALPPPSAPAYLTCCAFLC